jgi:hypothetical protein
MMSSRASRMITIGCGQGKLFSRSLHNRRHSTGYFSPGERCRTVLGIRDILVRIRISDYGSGSESNSGSDSFLQRL